MFQEPLSSIAALPDSKYSVSWLPCQETTSLGMEPSLAICTNTFRAAAACGESMCSIASAPAFVHRNGAKSQNAWPCVAGMVVTNPYTLEVVSFFASDISCAQVRGGLRCAAANI